MGCGKEYTAIVIWDNGVNQKHTVMVCINGKMEIDMKEVGFIVSNTEKVVTFSQMVTHILENMLMVVLKEKVYINGKMEVYTQVILKKE